MQYIIAIGIFQALVAIVLLWQNKLRSNADSLLILLVACIGTHLAIKFVIYSFVQDVHVRYQMNTFIALCYGPLLYLYALKVRDPAFIPASKWYVFLPFIIGAIAYFTVAGVLFFNSKPEYSLLDWYNSISFWILVPSDIFFAVAALFLSHRYLEKVHRERQLVARIACSFLVLSGLSIAFYFAGNIFGANGHIYFRSVIYALLAGLIVMIIRYKYVATESNVLIPATNNPAAIPEMPVLIATQPGNEALPAIEPEPAVRKNTLAAEEQMMIWQQLEQYLGQSRIFADSELSLDKLATATGISKYHISETLNSYAHKTFYQYINEYRIGFAVTRMQQLNEKSVPVNILSLAYDAGFKAKSSFNRYFKDITGVTPTEYLKSLQQVGAMPGITIS